MISGSWKSIYKENRINLGIFPTIEPLGLIQRCRFPLFRRHRSPGYVAILYCGASCPCVSEGARQWHENWQETPEMRLKSIWTGLRPHSLTSFFKTCKRSGWHRHFPRNRKPSRSSHQTRFLKNSGQPALSLPGRETVK